MFYISFFIAKDIGFVLLNLLYLELYNGKYFLSFIIFAGYMIRGQLLQPLTSRYIELEEIH